MAEPIEILLADDSDVGRYLIATMLRRAGYTVREAADGTEAIAQIAARPPDLAILDVKMPELDGMETVRRLKADPVTARVPVLLLSATFRESADRVEGLDLGADAYLTQPIEAQVLLASVRALLRVRVAERRERLIATQWQVTFDAIEDAVALVDDAGRIRRANRAFAELAGLDGPEVAVGRVIGELLPVLAEEGLRARAIDLEVGMSGRVLRLHVDELPDLEQAGHAVLSLRDVTAETELSRERERVLQRERLISSTLQEALVLRQLPRVVGLELDSHYALAETDVLLGGDWFDAIRTEAGVWLALGDIAGHGVVAVAQAVQLRNSLRLMAEDGYTPGEAMARLGELLGGGEMIETASAIIAAFDLRAQTAQIVCAGHPPPILVRPDGSTEVLHAVRGTLLGFGDRYEPVAIDIAAGTTIVLYTDGIVERRREPIDAGIARLEAAVRANSSVIGLGERVFAQLLPEGPEDDATILAARWTAQQPTES